jgi:hypothetical protein
MIPLDYSATTRKEEIPERACDSMDLMHIIPTTYSIQQDDAYMIAIISGGIGSVLSFGCIFYKVTVLFPIIHAGHSS